RHVELSIPRPVLAGLARGSSPLYARSGQTPSGRAGKLSRMTVRQSEKGSDLAHDALLSDPGVVAQLERLADMRDACYARPHWPGAIPRYWSAVENSVLRARFAWSELDHL